MTSTSHLQLVSSQVTTLQVNWQSAREDSDCLYHTFGTCRCIVGPCQPPLRDGVTVSAYRIMPCGLECDEVSSKEWWGQDPTSTENINGVIATNQLKVCGPLQRFMPNPHDGDRNGIRSTVLYTASSEFI